MGQPLSMDLLSRVLAAIDDGMSCRSAAARFGVAPSTAIRWHEQRRDTGSFAPKPQGGDTGSRNGGTTSWPSGMPARTSPWMSFAMRWPPSA